MPVKRRVTKARQLDEHHRAQLLDGPEACLLAGAGYLAGCKVGAWAMLDDDDRSRVLADMVTDWQRHGASLTAEWRRGGALLPGCRPWAAAALPQEIAQG